VQIDAHRSRRKKSNRTGSHVRIYSRRRRIPLDDAMTLRAQSIRDHTTTATPGQDTTRRYCTSAALIPHLLSRAATIIDRRGKRVRSEISRKRLRRIVVRCH